MQDRVTDLIPARPLVVVAQYLNLRLLERAVRGAAEPRRGRLVGEGRVPALERHARRAVQPARHGAPEAIRPVEAAGEAEPG